MKVSIVIPCYNCEDYIEEAIESALSQDCADKEIIVVDDGSSDGSSRRVERFPEVRKLSQANAGVSAARNAGLAASAGEFIVFLDADDRLLPGALSTAAEVLTARAELPMTFGGNRKINANGDVFASNIQRERTFGYAEILDGVTPCPSQCMFRRSALQAAGGFDTSIKLSEDWDLYLRLARIGPIFCHGKIVADYRTHGGQSRVPSAALRSGLAILRENESRFPRGEYRRAFRISRRRLKIYYGRYIPGEILKFLWAGRLAAAAGSTALMARALPFSLLGFAAYLCAFLSSRPGRLRFAPRIASFRDRPQA
jgi:glycosyltransferase involved in cell wall biosynthesis